MRTISGRQSPAPRCCSRSMSCGGRSTQRSAGSFTATSTSRTKRAAAHAQASDFTKTWAARLPGKEQAAGLVESIWHEAVRLRLTSDSDAMMEEELVNLPGRYPVMSANPMHTARTHYGIMQSSA